MGLSTQKPDNNVIELVEVFDEDMEKRHILCLPDKKDHFRLIGTSFLSLLFHVCVYALVTYASITYPAILATSDKEVIWLYPSLLVGSLQTSDSIEKIETTLKTDSLNESADLKDETTQEPTLDEGINIFTSPVVIHKTVKHTLQKQPLTEPSAKEPAAAIPEQQKIAALENEENPKDDSLPPPQPPIPSKLVSVAESPAAQEDNPIPDKEKPVFNNASVKTVPIPTPAIIESPKRPEIIKPQQPIAPAPVIVKKEQIPVPTVKKDVIKTQTKPAAKLKTAKTTIPLPKESAKRPKTLPITKAVLPPPQKIPVKAVVALPAPGLTNGTNRQDTKQENDKAKEIVLLEPEKKPKGFFIPPLPGDLKFEITSDENIQRGVKVTVHFRDFPKARRNRALSKSEATRILPLAPKTVFTGPNTILAVVENSGEGVYYLRLALEHKESIQGAITIKLFDSGPRARTMSIKKQKLNNNVTIVRIMMPEGILWDDSTAFTGSMEDSDSVTKYNSDNGLVWKEYN